MRFLWDLYRAIRARVGKDYSVIIELNGYDYPPWRPGLKTSGLTKAAKAMEQEGIDAVEVSVGQYESGFPMVRSAAVCAIQLSAACAICAQILRSKH